ncbi:MAG: hypothetical protein EPO07_17730 [Verrucomicrobia bacterium]|nr:MAG: hypothetical protein EPO07_17730 [Verrucomicrobiota bacterium]
MNVSLPQLNLVVAWLWILLGFATGMVLGMFFHGENWLGGYASFQRRMYRLAHISFFGLGAVNLLFWLTVKDAASLTTGLRVAAIAFVVGAVTMPVCSVLMAQFPKAHLIFSIPVLSLILAGSLTVLAVVRHETTANELFGATNVVGVVSTEEPSGSRPLVAPITIQTNHAIPFL